MLPQETATPWGRLSACRRAIRPSVQALLCLPLLAAYLFAQAPSEVQVATTTVTLPTYEFSARDTQPGLFADFAGGLSYPFVPYRRPFKNTTPGPKTYQAITLENEYVKLTYLPAFGGRIFSLYDKVRHREVFYRNDVIKPAGYNVKDSFPLFGLELTGPWDTHSLTLNGEPFWSNRVITHPDGSATLVLGSIDPVYHMKVDLSATLHPGLAAMEMSVFCYNARDGRMPQMFWLSGSLRSTPKTRFVYPMTRTIGHTTSEIADWPVFNGTDYSFDANNKHMLGVFGIDIYDNFQGAYHEDLDYGVFRYADRRIVQGMKMWTFGDSPTATNLEHAYTDHAGPYIEIQSGRMVWDGHYEWVQPHKFEQWSELWVPVAGIGGLTTLTRDVALHLEARNGNVSIGLSAARAIPGARITVRSAAGPVFETKADLAPGQPFRHSAPAATAALKQLTVTVADTTGRELLNYIRPDSNPGRIEYTPFTRPLEQPAKSPDRMSIEELVLAAEFKLKELKDGPAQDLLDKALARDPGYSRAHLLLGIHAFNAYDDSTAIRHLDKAIARDPYLDEAYYYLAVAQLRAGQPQKAERNLYYIWPGSAYYPDREYNLARIAWLAGNLTAAATHAEAAVKVNGYHLTARALLSLIARQQGHKEAALAQIAALEKLDPTSALAQSEKWLLTASPQAEAELTRLLGGQSQEAMDATAFYRGLNRYADAVKILELVERHNHDPWGTPAEFDYVLAHALAQSGAAAEAGRHLAKARASRDNIDRFPYREETLAALEWAVAQNPEDAVAHFNLACLDYYLHRPGEALRHWEAAVAADPNDFRTRRTLGLAYAEQGKGVEMAAGQLEKAVALNPSSLAVLYDLSAIYARAGRFTDQLVVLKKGLERAPNDDGLAEDVLNTSLVLGHYDDASHLIATHKFQPRHRSYGLRDKYRAMRFALAAAAFRKADYATALENLNLVMKPPVSLGVDDFVSQTSPRLDYYLGRTLEATGKPAEARQAYERAAAGADSLSGDRDSWNSENFFMVPALERLGRKQEAARLLPRFANFARTEIDDKRAHHRAESNYLLGLIAAHDGRAAEARKLFEEALRARPDLLLPRMELRGESIPPTNQQP